MTGLCDDSRLMSALDLSQRAMTIFNRRQGRKLAGLIAVMGAGSAMFLGSVAPMAAVCILGGTWLAAGAAYVMERWTALKPGGADRTEAELDYGADALSAKSAVATLRSPAANQVVRLAAVRELAVGSIAWPLAGLSLLAPLSIHFLVYAIASAPEFSPSWLEGFGAYMTITSVLLIPAYATLIACARRHAQRLARVFGPPATERAGVHALAATTISSLVPGFLLLGIPTLIVLITGALFIPASFAMARRTHRREHETLLALEQEVSTVYSEETFEAIQRLALDAGCGPASRLMALRMLESHPDRARVREVFDALLTRDGDDLTVHVLDGCRAIQHRPAVDTLTRLGALGRSKVAEKAVKLLVACHGTSTEPFLRQLLTAPTYEARVAALKGLGQVGTRASIESIRTHIHRPGTELPAYVAYAVIDAIKARLPAAAPGQLSLAPTGAGELALASRPAHGLALPRAPTASPNREADEDPTDH